MTDIEILFKRITECFNRNVLEALKGCAERYDTILRERGEGESFFNITGNLRSSLGTAVIDHGRKYFESQFATIMNGTEGSSKGKSMIDTLTNQYMDCVALVIVAAEDYASFVEDKDSKDVVASVTTRAELEVQKYIEQGIAKACKEINSWK